MYHLLTSTLHMQSCRCKFVCMQMYVRTCVCMYVCMYAYVNAHMQVIQPMGSTNSCVAVTLLRSLKSRKRHLYPKLLTYVTTQ